MKVSWIKDNCSRVDDITGEPSLKIKCRRGNCAEWCKTFAGCLQQSIEWRKKCARKFKKLFTGHRRTKIKVNARGNQSSYNIDVTFCGWKGRYQVYKLSDSASQEYGMYMVPFVLNMRSFLIKNFICLFINPSGRPISRSLLRSFDPSQSSINLVFSLIISLLFNLFIIIIFLLPPRLFKSLNPFSGL